VSREFNYIVRLHGTNLDGTKAVPYALSDVKGIGIRVALSLTKAAGVDPTHRLGSLSEAEVKRLEEALKNPQGVGLPKWMLNHQKEPMTGKDVHLLSSDLDLRTKDEIDLMRETRSWKGDRHARGLKLRGQHTKTTGRKGRSVGVSKKKEQQPKGGAGGGAK
jgi:small subunit ribosomal protein S13